MSKDLEEFRQITKENKWLLFKQNKFLDFNFLSLLKISFIFFLLAILYCGVNIKTARSDSIKTNTNTNISYNIEKNSCFEPYKCSYDVRIKSKLSEDELLTIAYEIFDNTPAVNNVFITFYLPCMKIGQGAWANAIFDPMVNVNIMDFSLTNNPACLNVK